jgi:hypothetical protein
MEIQLQEKQFKEPKYEDTVCTYVGEKTSSKETDSRNPHKRKKTFYTMRRK